MSHETALLSPSRNFAVHEVEEKSEGHESERGPYRCVCVRRTKAIPHGAEDGHETTEACNTGLAPITGTPTFSQTVHLRDQICEMQCPSCDTWISCEGTERSNGELLDHREMPSVGGKELFLLLLAWAHFVRMYTSRQRESTNFHGPRPSRLAGPCRRWQHLVSVTSLEDTSFVPLPARCEVQVEDGKFSNNGKDWAVSLFWIGNE